MNSGNLSASKGRRSLFWRIWFRSVSVKRPQAALALGSLLVGSALAATLLNLHSDIRRKMTQEFRSYGANVVLAPAVSLGNPNGAGLMNEDVVAHLAAWRERLHGLNYAAMLHGVVRLRRSPADPRLPDFQNAVAAGADFAVLRSLYPDWRIDGGSGLTSDGECLVGVHVAKKLHVGIGGSIQLEYAEAQDTSAAQGQQPFKIVGVLSTGGAEDDQIFVRLPALQQLAGLQGKVSVVELSVPGGPSEIERTMKELTQSLPGVEARAVHAVVESQGKVLDTIRWLLVSLTALILAIIALCVTATMTAIVLERKRDIAVMKALGATDLLLMRLFMSEGAALGLLGGLAGFVVGLIAASILGHRLFAVNINPSWWTLPFVCLLTTVLALLATAIPVRLARTVEPARVLKGE